MKRFTLITLVIFSFFYKSTFSQNATMTIKNKSDRYINVKLMQGPERNATIYKIDSIAPKSTLVFDVYETGLYFTKLRAILYDKKDPIKNDTIYSKNRPMKLISDKKRGHSDVTIEFTIKESKNESVSITRKEFDN
jgi:PDZ domain-containing secreted protein